MASSMQLQRIKHLLKSQWLQAKSCIDSDMLTLLQTVWTLEVIWDSDLINNIN
jgi:hypothetical protein